MPNYKVHYAGFMCVEADSAEEAEEKFHDGDFVLQEEAITSIEEVDEFVLEVR